MTLVRRTTCSVALALLALNGLASTECGLEPPPPSVKMTLARIEFADAHKAEARFWLDFRSYFAFLDDGGIHCKGFRLRWSQNGRAAGERTVALPEPLLIAWNRTTTQCVSMPIPDADGDYELSVMPDFVEAGWNDYARQVFKPSGVSIRRHSASLFFLTASVLALGALLAFAARRHWRFHLSTCVGVVMLAGAMLGLNSRETYASPDASAITASPGWPVPLLSGGIWLDSVLFLAVLVAGGYVLERVFRGKRPPKRN